MSNFSHVYELAGRMYETADIQLAIDAKQLTTVEQILAAVQERVVYCSRTLEQQADFELAGRMYEAKEIKQAIENKGYTSVEQVSEEVISRGAYYDKLLLQKPLQSDRTVYKQASSEDLQ